MFTLGAISFAIAVPFAVDRLLAQQWPVQHDLSDIASGLIRFFATILSGLVSSAAAIGALAVRIKRVRARHGEASAAPNDENRAPS